MTESSLTQPYSFSNDDWNEDWLKTLSWDFQHYDGSDIDQFEHLFKGIHYPPTEEDVQRVKKFTQLPSWIPAPQQLKIQTAKWLMEWDRPGAERLQQDGTTTFAGISGPPGQNRT